MTAVPAGVLLSAIKQHLTLDPTNPAPFGDAPIIKMIEDWVAAHRREAELAAIVRTETECEEEYTSARANAYLDGFNVGWVKREMFRTGADFDPDDF